MAIEEKRTGLLGVLDRIPARLILAMMVFFAAFCNAMIRLNMFISILAMVQQTDANGMPIEMPNYGPRYTWSNFEQSLLLGAYFWGFSISMIPSGILTEKFGGKIVVLFELGTCAVLTALSPVLAQFNFWISFLVRLLIGVFSGGIYPSLYKLISEWAPPDEKGKFTAALMGANLSTAFTWPLVGALIETVGWDFGFYVPAVLAIVFTLVWWYVTYDTPAQHPRILLQEKEYIESQLVGITHTKAWPPLLQMVLSIPFWSLFVLHYGCQWGVYFLQTGAPKYMNEVLGFNLSTSGILASLPYLVRFFTAIAFGSIGDLMVRRQTLSVTNIRKLFCITSHIIPGLFLIAIPYIGDHPYVCVGLLTLSLGFNGSSSATNLQNSYDLAPNYAATTFGIINAGGTTAGFITPLIVAYFIRERNTVEEWNNVFLIGAAVYIVSAILFMIAGSGNIQKWNDTPMLAHEETTDNKIKQLVDKNI